MLGWTIPDWKRAYGTGGKPAELLHELRASLSSDDTAWISIVSASELDARLTKLAQKLDAVGGEIDRLPLYGVPFAAKDNINVEGLDTTAGCPAFAYSPDQDATIIRRLTDAGAIVIGKTNLDQFATGLVGVRSPYGIPANTFDASFVSGGSSSGSASVVARGIVPFALGTDTAGSGRVPAGLNNIVGIKPTRGAFSNTGVVPACRTLDCVSVFATTVGDAATVYDVAAVIDLEDGLSRAAPQASRDWRMPAAPRIAIPAQPEFFGDEFASQAFQVAIGQLEAQGATCVPIDFTLFDDVASLLYDGPWVAERFAAIREFATTHEIDIHPVVRNIIFKAKEFSAADAFDGVYRLADHKRRADALLSQFDAILVPTAPTHYRIADVLADPVRLNSNLGKYTNFVNLLDWSAVSVPASIREDGLPFGITFIGDAWQERGLAAFAGQWHDSTGLTRGATGLPLNCDGATLPAHRVAPANVNTIRVAVVGAHLRGMPLNHELVSRGARFVASTTTASNYRLFALANTTPPKPGLMRSDSGAPIRRLGKLPRRQKRDDRIIPLLIGDLHVPHRIDRQSWRDSLSYCTYTQTHERALGSRVLGCRPQ
jgi:allophanate hydrolase